MRILHLLTQLSRGVLPLPYGPFRALILAGELDTGNGYIICCFAFSPYRLSDEIPHRHLITMPAIREQSPFPHDADHVVAGGASLNIAHSYMAPPPDSSPSYTSQNAADGLPPAPPAVEDGPNPTPSLDNTASALYQMAGTLSAVQPLI